MENKTFDGAFVFCYTGFMKRLLAFLCLGLTACGATVTKPVATEDGYRMYLDTWLGYSAAELVGHFGHPQYERVSGDKRYFMYAKSRLVAVDVENQAARMPQIAYAKSLFGKRASGTIQKSCYTTFLIEDNTVTGWRFDGNDCVREPLQ